MPDTTVPATELTSQYLTQVTGDLERNVNEQERISAEITTLQERLAMLRHDHTVLVNMQQALEAAAPTTEPADSGLSPTVPAPRKRPAAESGTRTKKTTAAQGRATAKKQSAKKPPTATADAKTAQPTLIELIRRDLTEHSDPRSAADISVALGEAHPDRRIKTTVVRTTLENLVARNQAQRTKQGASVFYTAPTPPEPAAASLPSATDPGDETVR
ncbi:putative regulatory protein [Streptomyces sp. NBRC 110611]|uniref:hypothetical protein n=1 Tax=Streptomyces sp. NBRC 110611 TaxID=1621259 RepID=UPI0008311F89|nr:hypothetical protein [Streptomyces sp. NBRC 110611]GAU70360.1 putative regulatory protein [Streptomyces sp. NBRC 110611]